MGNGATSHAVLHKRAFGYDAAQEEFDSARDRLGRAIAERVQQAGPPDSSWLLVRCRELVRAHGELVYAQRRFEEVLRVRDVVRGEATA